MRFLLEGIDGMSLHLTVRWTVLPGGAPRPWLHCHHCGTARPFVFSGKARLNANGRRLDAWLIYRCIDCDETWNRPVLERQSLSAVPNGLLQALHENDAATLGRLAGDRPGLARFAKRIEDGGQATVRRTVIGAVSAASPALAILLDPVGGIAVRPDRLLASELSLSRRTVTALACAGHLMVSPGSARSLRRPLRTPLRLDFHLGGRNDSAAILAAAGG